MFYSIHLLDVSPCRIAYGYIRVMQLLSSFFAENALSYVYMFTYKQHDSANMHAKAAWMYNTVFS